MEVDTLRTDDRAVSPVVGVALLIAITVILAAVIGGVVLGLGTSSAEAPQASLDLDTTNISSASVVHNGGEALDGNNVEVRDSSGTQVLDLGDLKAGESSATFDASSYDELSVVWTDPNSDDEAVLATFDL